MIILNKKRILVIVATVCLGIFVFTIQVAQKEKIVETVALPVSNKVIVIDARAWCTR